MGCMVIDIGGGSTDIAVISMGGRVRAASLPVAGNAFDQCIAQYVQEKFNIAIGPLTAEALKKQVACCTKSEFEGVMEIRGHSWETNLPARRLVYTRDYTCPCRNWPPALPPLPAMYWKAPRRNWPLMLPRTAFC